MANRYVKRGSLYENSSYAKIKEREEELRAKALAFVRAFDVMLLEDSGCSVSIDWQGHPGCGKLFDACVEARNEINRLVRPEAYR